MILVSLFSRRRPIDRPGFYPVQVGQEIEVRPGIVSKDAKGKLQWKPIESRIVTLFAEQNDLEYAVPGGLIGTFIFVSLVQVLKKIFLNYTGSIHSGGRAVSVGIVSIVLE